MTEEESIDLILDALRVSRERGPVVTARDTAGLREIAAQIRASAVFTARGTSAAYASVMKKIFDELSAGNIGEADARVTLLEALRALGYTPEGGFPDAPAGKVPPALAGTLQDLSSPRRLDLIVRTQTDLMAGAGQQFRGHTADRLAVAPAWELIRVLPVRESRDWRARWTIAGGKPPAADYPEHAYRVMYAETGMIALKGDPVWGELGQSGNFPDALDVDHPPFAFNSGMGWREVNRAECKRLGITGPKGESIADFQASQPHVLRGKLPVPTPRQSIKDLAPAIAADLIQKTGAKPVPGKPGMIQTDDLSAAFRARRAAARAEQ